MIAAAHRRRRHEHDARAWAVWHVARLTAYAPEKAKDFVKLEKLLSRDARREAQPASDWRSQLAKVTAWVKGR